MKEQWGKTHENLNSKADELFEREDKIQQLKKQSLKNPSEKQDNLLADNAANEPPEELCKELQVSNNVFELRPAIGPAGSGFAVPFLG